MSKQYEYYWKYFNIELSESFKNLFIRMVSYNPDERPSIDEIFKSEWLKELEDLKEDSIQNIEDEIKKEFHNRHISYQRNIVDYSFKDIE